MSNHRTTPRANRRRWTSVQLEPRDMADDLQRRHSLRWHGLCIGTLTLLGMLGAAWCQKQLGVHLLSVRYAITLAVGYGIYLLIVRVWAQQLLEPEGHRNDSGWDGADLVDAVDVADMATSAVRSVRSMGSARGPSNAGHWSADAADAVDAADAAKGLGDVAAEALDGLGSADEGAVVVIPVIAIFIIGAAIAAGAGALAMLFFSWDVLLTVAVELAFSVAAARVASRVEREGWLSAAVRLTWKPLLGALLCAVALGAAIDHFMPQVDSLPEAVRLMMR